MTVPPEGSLLVLQDVVIERRHGHEMWTPLEDPARAGTESIMALAAPGLPERRQLRTPAVSGEDVQYRLRLAVKD
jgi:hypothetical protein